MLSTVLRNEKNIPSQYEMFCGFVENILNGFTLGNIR